MNIKEPVNQQVGQPLKVRGVQRGSTFRRNGSLCMRVEMCELNDAASRHFAQASQLYTSPASTPPRFLQDPVWILNLETGRVWAIEGNEDVMLVPTSASWGDDREPAITAAQQANAVKSGHLLRKAVRQTLHTAEHAVRRLKNMVYSPSPEMTGLFETLEHAMRGLTNAADEHKIRHAQVCETPCTPRTEFDRLLKHYGDLLLRSARVSKNRGKVSPSTAIVEVLLIAGDLGRTVQRLIAESDKVAQ